jgi:hypothetical protein
MLDFSSHMNDEILVEYAGVDEKNGICYKITSSRHYDPMTEIAGKDKFHDADLEQFKKLGYAVCNNKLDEHGKRVYIHHNIRTFKENKDTIGGI